MQMQKYNSTEELGDVKLVYAGDRAYLRAEASRAMGNNPVASVAMEKYNGGKYVYYVMQRNALELRGNANYAKQGIQGGAGSYCAILAGIRAQAVWKQREKCRERISGRQELRS